MSTQDENAARHPSTDSMDDRTTPATPHDGTGATEAPTETDAPAGALDTATAQSDVALEDEWAAALAEQQGAPADEPDPSTPAAEAAEPPAAPHPLPEVFKPLAGTPRPADSEIDMIKDIPVQLSVELGRTRLTIRNILQLSQGSVVELDGLAGEPMDIYVNGYLIAQGEVVVVDEKYGIRVTDIITPADRIARLNSRR